MPAKKTTAPASTPLTLALDEARAAYAKLRALAGTSVRLTRDVPNPCVDKRVRWSRDLDAAPAVIPAGTLVAVEGSEEARFTLRFDGTQVAWLPYLAGFAGAPYALPGGGSEAERRVARDLLDALGAPERTWDALCASREAVGYSGWARRTLRHLVESGRLTLDEVEAACIAAEDEDKD